MPCDLLERGEQRGELGIHDRQSQWVPKSSVWVKGSLGIVELLMETLTGAYSQEPG